MTAASKSQAPIVLKVGGEVVNGPYLGAIAADVAALAREGTPVVIVHGGGPQATALQKQLGQTPNIVGGRRVTDQATLDVMKMTLAGKVNVDLCAALLAAGAKPVGLHGASSAVIRAVKRPARVVSGGGPDPVDFGFVGDVIGLRKELLDLLLGAGYVPVLACLGADEQGQVFNINADTVANQAAIALGARSLFLVTDVPAVLRDVNDPSSRIPRLSIAEGERAIAEGVVTKGMIPKLEESFAAISAGVRAVHIVGRLASGDLAREANEPGSIGTVLTS
ncbi:acetylglutamate kinase [Pendulispora albinea]|uniref:Acetylglutamate kinase n=1 Tax=Pendulispora albinea TaxID=2741071 RepID=A0ABZ2LNF5_9BACT